MLFVTTAAVVIVMLSGKALTPSLIVIAAILSVRTLQRVVPSESLLAFGLVGLTLTALLYTGNLG